MIKRVKNVLFKSFSRVGETALLLAFFTFLSQLLSFFRDRFLAGNVGVGEQLDVYYAAFRIPDTIFILTLSLVSLSALLPFLQTELREGKEHARRFLSEVFTVFSLLVIGIGVFTFFLSPFLVKFLFRGFSPSAVHQTVVLSRIMLLSPLFLGISAIFSTVVQSAKKFLIYAIAPVFYNLGIIIGILFFYPHWGIRGLAYGVVLGAILHLAIQYLVVKRESLTPSLTFHIRWKKIFSLIKNSLPRVIALSLSNIFLLILLSYATRFVEGSVSIFQLSYNLRSVPLSLIGLSYSVASFPILVRLYQEKSYTSFLQHIFYSLRQIVFWSLPAITLFIVLRAHIVRVILGTGNFNWNDTKMTAASLAILVMSVLAQGINILIIRAYYASGKTWKPFIVLFSSLSLTLPSLIFMLRYFSHHPSFYRWVEFILRAPQSKGVEVLILSFAYVFWTYLSLLLFMLFFPKDFSFTKDSLRGIIPWKSFLQSFFASLFLGITLYFSLHLSVTLFNQHYTFGLFMHALVSAFFSFLLWFALLLFWENEDAKIFKESVVRIFHSFRKKLSKGGVTGDIEISIK